MNDRSGLRFVLLLLVGTFIASSVAQGAGIGASCSDSCADCPSPSYSRLHYWVPTLYRIHEHLHHPRPCGFGPDCHPQAPLRFQVDKYPCPAVPPAAFYGKSGSAY